MTHDAGGITKNDINLARILNSLGNFEGKFRHKIFRIYIMTLGQMISHGNKSHSIGFRFQVYRQKRKSNENSNRVDSSTDARLS